MENKITLSGLAAMIALASGQPGQLCEDFLKELFRIIGDELEKGENVRIKGLGTFKVADVEARKSVDLTTREEIEIPHHRKVIFVASKELAALVNAPFEAFEAVEVSDALPTDELLDIVDDVEPDNFADENEIAETDDSVESEESQDYSDSENILTIAKQDKNLESPEETEVAQPMTPVPEKLKKAEAVGPVIITYDITSVKDKHFEDDESDSVSVVSGKDKAAVEVDEIEEKEEPGTPVISFSSPVSSAATRKRNISDNDSGELDDKESPAPKETIKTIRFESAEANEDDEAVAGKSRSRFGSGFLIGFLSAIAIIALVMLIGVKFDMMPEKVSNMLTKNSPAEDGSENEEGMENEDSFSGVPVSDSIRSDDASA
ncbi:MAG: HU family DNA-binding protein, partial [Muribaculaceae bacterium]|nr:HU family DNA-binding protein [Muribaculaceae bacterium]